MGLYRRPVGINAGRQGPAGYISPQLINETNADGQCIGICGIPANYKPAGSHLIPYGSTTLPPNAPARTNISSYWDTNTV